MATSLFAPQPPSVAIEIASRRVTVVSLRRSSSTATITGHATEALPEGLVTPALTGANITDRAAVAAAVTRALERAGLRSARRAALIIPDGAARVSLLTFEQVPSSVPELDQLVRWQLRKSTPFPLDDAQISHVPAHTGTGGTTLAAVVARKDVVAQYEAVAEAAGVHPGLVDLASFNVMNAVMAAGAGTAGDWLVVCLAPEGTTLAILRGSQLMFYRHRPTIDAEPLSALVHQTAMYHEDRLGGGTFANVWLSGDATDQARRQISERLRVSAEVVDVRPVAALPKGAADTAILDSVAAGVGALLRDRKAA